MPANTPVGTLKTWVNVGEVLFGNDLNGNFSEIKAKLNAHSHDELAPLVHTHDDLAALAHTHNATDIDAGTLASERLAGSYTGITLVGALTDTLRILPPGRLIVGVAPGGAMDATIDSAYVFNAIIGSEAGGWSETLIGGKEGYYDGTPYAGTSIRMGVQSLAGGWKDLVSLESHEWLARRDTWFTQFRPNGTFFHPLSLVATETDEWVHLTNRTEIHSRLQVTGGTPTLSGPELTSTSRPATFVGTNANWTEIGVFSREDTASNRGAGIQFGSVSAAKVMTPHCMIGSWKAEANPDPYMFFGVEGGGETRYIFDLGWEAPGTGYMVMYGNAYISGSAQFAGDLKHTAIGNAVFLSVEATRTKIDPGGLTATSVGDVATTTAANAGELVVGNNKSIRAVNAAGTSTLPIARLANDNRVYVGTGDHLAASVTWSTSDPSGTPRAGHIWIKY
jgi:hypothetical protein